ncbi:BREX-1 system adenine-specific DNA-methyltransferase PglX [Novosphingobium sp.]|uniref:BREX-1 system adenine-specific DNA-methyltransferase PglX n=1 Tax=Novosphingobium sp. TaxID=1874826 RepID=UPI0025D504BD|nr:BREX-1 system adenine-specific DNA-methyltransferase PglX [Novosphingobium sp.]
MASNRSVLKKYAPQARLDFIQAVTNRAALLGITKEGNVAGEVQGDLFILNGKAFPRSVASQRGRLISRIARDGFAHVMEAVAYTWFNRLLAIRYMELHDYLDHGCRVLSNPTGHNEPEILEKAVAIDLPGIDRDEIVNLKLDGTKDEQIYRKLLIAQCNDLHRAMPFLFERIDDETELLLPENLLQSDSIVRKLVNEIDEAEWQEIEIVGWLYQFYISEKKDQVIGKVVKSEDIPAATQLFTPNWIVKYMVQNTLGAHWLATYPDSAVRAGMEYYIAPAEQTPEVQAQIDAITPKQLDPEAITLIDPAVGSGHILVEAYDLFRAIYLERGYTKREAARAILTKNLFGLDIDDRAAQMAGFALLMKACADDRTVLRNPPKLNVLALQDSDGLDADALAKALLPQLRFEMVPSGDLLPETLSQPTLSAQQPTSAEAKAIKALVTLFVGAKTFGSLITVPDSVKQSLPLLDALLAKPLTGDLLLRQAQQDAQEALKPLVEQAWLIGGRYDCVVANPPYMGGKGMNTDLKQYLHEHYEEVKSDLFAAFIFRDFVFAKTNGRLAFMTPFVWMFLSSYEDLRKFIFETLNLRNLVKPSYTSFFQSAIVPICTFTLQKSVISNSYNGSYFDLGYLGNAEEQSPRLLSGLKGEQTFSPKIRSVADFQNIPGGPIAFQFPNEVFRLFEDRKFFRAQAKNLVKGIFTGDNARFLRHWHEISFELISKGTWRKYNKAGGYRKWYGIASHAVDWRNEGSALKNFGGAGLSAAAHFGKSHIVWSKLTSGDPSFRIDEDQTWFDDASPAIIEPENYHFCLALLNSNASRMFLKTFNPTMNLQPGDVGKVPVPRVDRKSEIQAISETLCELSRSDWDSFESSWDFSKMPLFRHRYPDEAPTLANDYKRLSDKWCSVTNEMQRLEEMNNFRFIEAYGLQDQLTPDVPLSDITLTCNPHYRYGGDLTDEQREARLKSDTMRELVSYAVGGMMGRYSLAEPGLIYAHSRNIGFDPSRYGAFPADDDGIIPLTDEQWFADDAAARIEEFLGVAWPKAPVMETMTTLMDGLAMGKAGEPRAALRSYLSKQFYKDHLQTYKNRPIYWLFSSGKQKAFEALVYLHRYNEGTLARMRTVYVTPLMGKLQQRINDLDAEIAASSSSAEKARKTRDKEKLAKQVVELRAFDEELRHLADQRITLDLDDGVKVNYARFGDLLAFKDKVCPKKKGEDD